MKKGIAVLLSIAVLFGLFGGAVYADGDVASYVTTVFDSATGLFSYSDYLENLECEVGSVDAEISISDDTVINKSEGVTFTDVGLNFSEEESFAEIRFNLDKAAAYQITFSYLPIIDSNYSDSSVEININGKEPFDGAREFKLNWIWKNEEGTTDSRGNEILSSPTAIEKITEKTLTDPSGRLSDPYLFGFKEGENTLKIVANTGNFVLKSIRLTVPQKTMTYAEWKESLPKADSSTTLLKLEAEDYREASSSTIVPDYDKGNVATSPNDSVKLLYNMISGDKYKQTGQWLLWEFTPEESGYYNIAIRARQNDKSGFSVARRLYINGELPFEECGSVLFPYSSNWQMKVLGDEEAYRFYFEKGKTYEIKLEVTAGYFSQITVDVDELIYDLNTLYRNVVMVAGTEPDAYRDYQLKTVIPNFEETIKALKAESERIAAEIAKYNFGKSGSSLTSFHTLINRLEKIIEDPDLLARTLSSYKSDIQSLSSWNQDAKEQPLDVDYLLLYPAGEDAPRANAGFFKNLLFNIKRIIFSFAEDYGVVGDIYDEESSLEVWLSTGRDQMGIIKNLVDNDFAAKHGVNVNVALITVDIRTAVLAGTAPDCLLYTSSDMAVNLALRGVLEDLSGYEGFSEVEGRFHESTMKPFRIGEATYAVPLSETFNMLFVRTDIFDELELKIPETWDEFYQVSTILQRNNLEVGIPTNIGMFATLLFQHGGEFYNEELTRTAFDTEEAITAFEKWTSLFAKYGFPLTYDFYNRFSSGEMPMAIVDYSQYLKVQSASPELSGRWEMSLIPGVKREDGSIDRSLSICAATGADTSPGLTQSITCALLFKNSKHKETAFEFLNWLTSDDIQSRYGRQIEDTLGSIQRYSSANVNAFKTHAWAKAERELILEQWESVRTINEIPGNYSVTRELINAFRNVVYENANPTDTIYTYNNRINKELERKQKGEE